MYRCRCSAPGKGNGAGPPNSAGGSSCRPGCQIRPCLTGPLITPHDGLLSIPSRRTCPLQTDDASQPVKLKRARKQLERAIVASENMPESQQYLQLIDLEKRLDTITSRKRVCPPHSHLLPPLVLVRAAAAL